VAAASSGLLPATARARFVHLANSDYTLTLVIPILIPKVPSRLFSSPHFLSVHGQETQAAARILKHQMQANNFLRIFNDLCTQTNYQRMSQASAVRPCSVVDTNFS
jgi:hypothetical protein